MANGYPLEKGATTVAVSALLNPVREEVGVQSDVHQQESPPDDENVYDQGDDHDNGSVQNQDPSLLAVPQ